MAKKKPLTELKRGDEITSLTKDELHKLRVKFSISVPKEDFDELLKAMMGDVNGDTHTGDDNSMK